MQNLGLAASIGVFHWWDSRHRFLGTENCWNGGAENKVGTGSYSKSFALEHALRCRQYPQTCRPTFLVLMVFQLRDTRPRMLSSHRCLLVTEMSAFVYA